MSARCPTCGADALPLYGTDSAVCQKCGPPPFRVYIPGAVGSAQALDPVDPCVAPPDAWDGLESALVQAIREDGVRCGYRVWRVGQRKAKGAGNEVAIPDTFLHRNDWPPAQWVAVEVKTRTGTWSDKQRANVRLGLALAAWSVADARRAVGLA